MNDPEKLAVGNAAASEVINNTIPDARTQPRWNHYTCPICDGVTIARHDDEGVTPFILRCRAQDVRHTSGIIVPGCKGQAQSCFFQCSQADTQIPHVIFYRPGPLDAIAAVNKEHRDSRAWYLDHYQKGGALMRLPATDEPFPVPSRSDSGKSTATNEAAP